VSDLEIRDLRPGDRVDFTFYWPEAERWEGVDFVVCIA
jgi:glucoamylase